MKRIVEYTEYRQVIRDYYEERKRSGGFSWREFARLCGYASPVYLKLVAEGKTVLSQIGVERVASALGLAARDREYFRWMVIFNDHKNPQRRADAFNRMRAIAQKSAVAVIGADQYDFYGEWYHSALRELAAMHPQATAEQLADLLSPKVSVERVRSSLELLQRLGLLCRDEQGRWSQTRQILSTGSGIRSLAVRQLHRQMADLAVRALDAVDTRERDISGLTMGLTQQAYERIVLELAEFRNRVMAIASETEGAERVYRLNLQLFPLSEASGG